MFKRVLEKWTPVEEWFRARATSAIRSSPHRPFPLSDKETELIQIMSLLTPITELKKLIRAEPPTQVRTLLTLFRVRMTAINEDLLVPRYTAASSSDQAVSTALLEPLVASTRIQLAEALDPRFCNRNTGASVRLSTPFLLKMQLLLQPEFNHLRGTALHTIKLSNA